MILANEHPLPPTVFVSGDDPRFQISMEMDKQTFGAAMYRVRKWRVTVSASINYGGDPEFIDTIEDDYELVSYADYSVGGTPVPGDPMDDSRQMEIFEEKDVEFSEGKFYYRSMLGPVDGATPPAFGSMFISRAVYQKDSEDSYKMFLTGNYGVMFQFLEDNPDTGLYTVEEGALVVTMGSVVWGIPLVVKTVATEPPYVQPGYSFEIEAIEFWECNEEYPGLFNSTDGTIVASPFEP